jgi:hypothetical protein
MYPVYIPGEVAPPAFGQSIWFTLTTATPTLKELLFPKFFDSEMGQDYALSEEPRDQEHLWYGYVIIEVRWSVRWRGYDRTGDKPEMVVLDL